MITPLLLLLLLYLLLPADLGCYLFFGKKVPCQLQALLICHRALPSRGKAIDGILIALLGR